MNPYIECLQWIGAGWKRWYASHGTRILGTASAAFGTLQAILAGISSSPQFQLLVTPKQFALLSVVNVALGIAVLKRGFTNSRQDPPKP